MKSVFTLLVVACVACVACVLTSCQMAKTHLAVGFNDTLVKLNQDITKDADAWGDSLTAYIKIGDLSKLRTQREIIEKHLTDGIEKVTKMDASIVGAEKLKREELTLLKIEQHIIGVGFRPYETFTKESADDEWKAAADNLVKLVKEEEEQVARLKQTQKQFAEDNNFKLEQKEL